MPLFGEFFDNVTYTQNYCVQRVEDSSVMMLPRPELEARLKGIESDCNDDFTGYLMEVVTSIDETMGIPPSVMIDIIVGGVRLPIDMPLKCVANELTSMVKR